MSEESSIAMDIKFLVPTIISVVAIAWSYFQSRTIEHLRSKIAKQVLVHKIQSEKEFEVYSELWENIVELKKNTLKFQPKLYRLHEDEGDFRKSSLNELADTYIQLSYTIEKNRPFYSQEVYELVIEHSKIAQSIFNWSIANEPSKAVEDWDELEKAIQLVIDSSEIICEAVRKRVASLQSI